MIFVFILIWVLPRLRTGWVKQVLAAIYRDFVDIALLFDDSDDTTHDIFQCGRYGLAFVSRDRNGKTE